MSLGKPLTRTTSYLYLWDQRGTYRTPRRNDDNNDDTNRAWGAGSGRWGTSRLQKPRKADVGVGAETARDGPDPFDRAPCSTGGAALARIGSSSQAFPLCSSDDGTSISDRRAAFFIYILLTHLIPSFLRFSRSPENEGHSEG